MASHYSIQKKWVDNFNKCPLVHKGTGYFNVTVARQLFYGKKDESYPAHYPENFQTFYNTHYELDRIDAIETLLKYLHFIGIKLRKEAVTTHLQGSPADFHVLMKKSYFLLRTLAHHREDLTLSNPFS